MFGINRRRASADKLDAALSGVISRSTSVPALQALVGSLGTPDVPDSLGDAVIALDSSVFLRLAGSDKSATVIDYLNSKHRNGVVLPGQAIQEFWNNYYNVVPSLAKEIRKTFDAFAGKLNSVGDDYTEFLTQIASLLQAFETENGHVFQESTISKTYRMLEVLQDRAKVPFVCRSTFHQYAAIRQSTKTPPGFRDRAGNDGDFFVWLDLLRGVQLLIEEGLRPSRVIFVTKDGKDDWSRDGTPHPILVAEAQALLNMKLTIMDLPRFLQLIVAETE